MYLVSGKTQTLDIVKVNTDGTTELVEKVNIAALGEANGFSAGDITSVDVNTDRDLVAIAVQNADFTANGVIVTLNYDGGFVAKYEAGVQPDMVTFSPNGNYILSANEGEPREGYGEGATCVHCGRESLAVLNHKGLCVACVGSTVAKFERHLREEYSKEQLELLNEMFDGRPLDYLRPVASQR